MLTREEIISSFKKVDFPEKIIESTSDVKNIIDIIAKKYESKDGDYNYFIDVVKKYVGDRYPFDFFRVNPDYNISKDIDSLKRKK